MTTKEQERKVLAQIKKLVEGLGEDSYIGTAFEGCFEIAEQNIENDWACSMKDRAETAERKLNALELRYKQDVDHLQGVKAHFEKKLDEADQTIKRLELSVENEREDKEDRREEANGLARGLEEALEENEALKTEIVKLKAKLYDLITK